MGHVRVSLWHHCVIYFARVACCSSSHAECLMEDYTPTEEGLKWQPEMRVYGHFPTHTKSLTARLCRRLNLIMRILWWQLYCKENPLFCIKYKMIQSRRSSILTRHHCSQSSHYIREPFSNSLALRSSVKTRNASPDPAGLNNVLWSETELFTHQNQGKAVSTLWKLHKYHMILCQQQCGRALCI